MFYRKHPRVITPTGSISMTKQSHKDECDINLIIKKYQKTGIIQHISQQTPSYTDLPDTLDYQQSLAILEEADYAFSTLPSVVREYFHNSPAEFLAAFTDPSQAAKLEEWGLAKKREEQAPTTPVEAPPPPTTPKAPAV
ncbi:internal scaffolding protein [robinz microvirus RP_87]|nr:internal scaffolding protein [robinz microvirus RP_87]